MNEIRTATTRRKKRISNLRATEQGAVPFES